MRNSISTLIKLKQLDLTEMIASRHLLEMEISLINKNLELIDKNIYFHIKDIELTLKKFKFNMELIIYLNGEIASLEKIKYNLVESVILLEEKLEKVIQKLNEANVVKKKYEKLESKTFQKLRSKIDGKIKREVEDLLLISLGGSHANQ